MARGPRRARPSPSPDREAAPDLEEVIDFVARGVGLSLVPRDSVEAARARGAIEILYAGSGDPCNNPVFLVSRVGSDIRPPLRRLAELIGAGRNRD